MVQSGGDDNLDGPEQDALFRIEGPDEDGCVWACDPGTGGQWCQNLGPVEAVAAVMANWLGAIDFGDAVADKGGPA